jgi:predicted metal-dependent hydrolase
VREFTQIENYRVEIWRRAFQRSMNLTVRPDGAIRVTCGKRLSQREIARFVGESEPFIQRRFSELAALRAEHPPKKLISGEGFLFFGEIWPLQVVWTWAPKVKVIAGENFLEMLAPVASTLEERQKALNRFYKKQAKLHLQERVEVFSARMGLKPSQISVRGQRTRWGSCSSDASISLNWILLAAPLEVIDYIVVHELAHIRHLNHSPDFWALVAEFHPQWKASKRWLKEHEFAIGVQFHTSAP